jgi:hypothetical protein
MPDRCTMRIGCDEHKELFCRTFIATHQPYDPRDLPWPELDRESLQRLRGIPFWSTALQVESNAGAMVSGFAESLTDPLIREAVALQGFEEDRHARLIATMVQRYGLPAVAREPKPTISERAFIDFGYEECLDSFFGFGIYRLARQVHFLPESLTSLFARLLHEEARHIVFFVNWIAYERVRRGRGALPLQALLAGYGYARALVGLVKTATRTRSGSGFLAADAGATFSGLTLASFLEACLVENEEQMAVIDERLLQPRVLPQIARFVLDAIGMWERAGRRAGLRAPRSDDGAR